MIWDRSDAPDATERSKNLFGGTVEVSGFEPESTSPGESHPQALPEPYVNLSAHTAQIIQSHSIPWQAPSEQKASVAEYELDSATDPPSGQLA